MNKSLLVVAMKEESQGLLELAGYDVLYTGLGKVNATYHLTKDIHKRRTQGKLPALIINFGTAGSRSFSSGQLVVCNKFVQRDMDVTALGFEIGQTPFENKPKIIEHKNIISDLPNAVCGSGDNFETGLPKLECDIVDMEAYALAKVCLEEQIPFVSIKYISDNADQEAAIDWDESLKIAARKFVDFKIC